MAGIYIHIPFCRQKCYYCDFYKTVNTSLQQKFISSLKAEAKVRKNYLQSENIATIYFGGGTPSVLRIAEIEDLLQLIRKEFTLDSDTEITLEANPDDLDLNYLKGIKKAGVNRLSVGIQSFIDEHLQKMNRRHNANDAFKSIENAAKLGFDNISIDLIYGLPNLNENQWKHNLQMAFNLPVQHLSAYHLTYHEGTPFYTWLKKGTLKELNENESVKQFNMLVDSAVQNNYEHYEISNFAKEELYSRHNTSYWMGQKYLGLGPSAHSFDGESRQWNVSNIEQYIKGIEQNTAYFENEILDATNKFNEYILTRIRTKWGVSLDYVNQTFGEEKKAHLLKQTEKYKHKQMVMLNNGILTLTREGLFISDEIMTDLIII